MRLPQSILAPFSTRVCSIIAVTLFATMVLCAGAAAQQLTCAPSTLLFGSVVIGQSETEVVSLSNGGPTSVTVSVLKTSGTGFNLSGLTLPLTLAAGQSVPFEVTFSPTIVGSTQAGITFTSNASNTSLQLGLGGTGATRDSLKSSPASVSFGQVSVGAKSTVAVVLTNTRSSKTKLYAFQMTGNGFSLSGPALPINLRGGQSVTVNLTFAPQAAGTSGGDLFVTGPNVNVPLSGIGTTPPPAVGQLTITPASVNFGNVSVGSTGTQALTVSATSASVTVSADTTSSSQFILTGATLPFTIPAGQSSSFNVAFKPTSSGTVSGALSFTSNASNGPNLQVPLTGTGTTITASGQLAIAPASLNFGDVNVGSTGTQAITLSASGASVTVSSDASSSSQFFLNGATLPFTIPAGQSSSLNVAFKPSASGTVSGSLSFTSNASNSTTVESLTGIGTTPQYSVSLSWNASTNVAGYNIYRSTSPTGSYARINSSLDATTAYTDSGVVAGQTYYYEATAVNSAGQESVPSTPPAAAAIP
jgi:Abnormal spindle-like microcephaly-assoc'd, ASPM-SPD-2-Hydin